MPKCFFSPIHKNSQPSGRWPTWPKICIDYVCAAVSLSLVSNCSSDWHRWRWWRVSWRRHILQKRLPCQRNYLWGRNTHTQMGAFTLWWKEHYLIHSGTEVKLRPNDSRSQCVFYRCLQTKTHTQRFSDISLRLSRFPFYRSDSVTKAQGRSFDDEIYHSEMDERLLQNGHI